MVTKTRLDKVLPKVRGWADGMAHPELYRFPELYTNDVQEYIRGQGELYQALDHLQIFGMAEVANSLLTAKQRPNTQSVIHMTHGFSRTLHADGINIISLKGRTQTVISSLNTTTRNMFGAIALGMPLLAKKFHQIVFSGLEQGYGIKNGHNDPGPDPLRYASMGLSIINEWLELPLDLDKLGLPRDPAWGPLVSHWREPDPIKLLPILHNACDIHVERIAVTNREAESGDFDFGSEFEAVHPTEILAVLRLRDLLKLPNPVLDHPLMNTPYAQITAWPGQVTQPDTLLEDFLAKARERDPQVMSECSELMVGFFD